MLTKKRVGIALLSAFSFNQICLGTMVAPCTQRKRSNESIKSKLTQDQAAQELESHNPIPANPSYRRHYSTESNRVHAKRAIQLMEP